MPKRFIAELAPRGGMVDTPARTPQGFARRLQNAYYRAGSWVWRAAARKLHSTDYSDTLVWIGARKTTGPGAPVWTLLAASAGTDTVQSKFLKLVGAVLVPMPYNGTPGPDIDDDYRWRQWRAVAPSDGLGVHYACRRGVKAGILYHVDPDSDQVTVAGIPAPPAPSVASSGTVGTLAAGVYPVAYRYYTADGIFSPWSPATLSGAIVLNEKRRWTIANSTHPRVVGKELAIGAVNGDIRAAYGSASLIIANNTTTTYDEDVAFTAIDVEVPVDYDLVVPPDNPEDCGVWDARLWLISNDPEPLLWASDIDASGGSQWETFNPSFARKIPDGSGQRYQAFRAWDRARAGVWTDASARIVSPAAGGRYTMDTLSDNHGAVSAAAVAIGAGVAAWFDGRNLVASRGVPGDAQVVSRGWVDKALAQVPVAYAERAVVHYVPNDGGAFHLSIPSASASTKPDLVLCWRPGADEWHTRKYLGGAHAPNFIGQIPAEDSSGWYTGATFPDKFAVYRLDAPAYQDEGGENIIVQIETSAAEPPAGHATVAVAREHIGVRRRPDANLTDRAATLSCSVSLMVNEVQGTPVVATMVAGADHISARAQNLSVPAEDVSVLLEFDHPDPLEVFDVRAECVAYQREMART